LHRHFPSGEIDHPPAAGHMPGMAGSFQHEFKVQGLRFQVPSYRFSGALSLHFRNPNHDSTSNLEP
jgi:hypothetical protein